MKFSELYFSEGFNVGEEVFIKNDKEPYIIKEILKDDTYRLVDKETKKQSKLVNRDSIQAKQGKITGFEKGSSTEPAKTKPYKMPKRMGKREKVVQTELF